jgi:hypothetical protein
VLVDQIANVTVEVRGVGLAEQVGNQVKISGTAFRSATPVAGASQVIQVTAVELITRGGCTILPPTTATSPAAKSGGISNGAKIAIAVVAVGGAAGGIVAATGGSKSR